MENAFDMSEYSRELDKLRAALKAKDAALEAKDAALEAKDAALEAKDAALEAEKKKNAKAVEAKDAALKAKDAALEAEKKKNAKALEAEKKKHAKAVGTYWNDIDTIWDKKLEDFGGSFETYKNIRSNNFTAHYKTVRNMLAKSEGVETVLDFEKLKEGSVYDAESVVTRDTDNESDSPSANEKEDSGGTTNHSKKYLKNLNGVRHTQGYKSKAHLFPADKNCNKYWLPELQMVLGANVEVTDAPDALMQWAARIHTNKLVFGMDHNQYFDDLEYGKILAIPLYESLDKVGEWTYQAPYEMLIVCDSTKTYQQLGVFYGDHVADATMNDVKHATAVLSEATRMLADSLLTNWDSHNKKFGEEDERMAMMLKMKEELEDSGKKVFVPTIRPEILLDDAAEPKLFKVKFGDLYKEDEEKKYIPDPLLVSIKSALNLSAHHYAKKCKLLPACPSVSSEESVEPWNTLQLPEEGSPKIETTFSEIRIVSDDKEDAVSISSDITS